MLCHLSVSMHRWRGRDFHSFITEVIRDVTLPAPQVGMRQCDNAGHVRKSGVLCERENNYVPFCVLWFLYFGVVIA